MNHLFDEILEFQYKIPFIFHLKNLLCPIIFFLLHPNLLKHIYKFYTRNICTPTKYSPLNDLQSILPNILSNYSLLFTQYTISDSSKRVTSTWPYTRIRSKREVFHWRESGGGWRWRTAAMIIITGHWGCARVEGCIVSGRGHRWQAPRFQRGRPYNRIGISLCHRNLMESDGARTATSWSPPTPTIILCAR